MTSLMDVVSVIVIFLLTRVASGATPMDRLADQGLVKSTSDLMAETGPTVYVSRRAIFVEDRLVMRLNDGRVRPEDKRKHFLGNLYDGVLGCCPYDNGPWVDEPLDAPVVLVVDPAVEFETLQDVMYTLSRAEHYTFEFRVLGPA